MRRLPGAVLPLLAVLWLILLIVAPLAVQRDVAALPALAVYQASSALCHQRAERSFRVAGMQMPVCGRCIGLYAAGAAGAVAAWFLGSRRTTPAPSTIRTVLVAAAVPMLLSVGLEWAGVIAGSNSSRFLSALPLGAAAGWLLEHVATDLPQWA
jgi:uncharacterized membrane protein